MNPLELETEVREIIEVNRADKWQVYLRLQQLDIPCDCGIEQPLRVKVQSAAAAVQVWSVVKQLTAQRQELTFWLNCCWQK